MGIVVLRTSAVGTVHVDRTTSQFATSHILSGMTSSFLSMLQGTVQLSLSSHFYI
jgi:hypothetical protein